MIIVNDTALPWHSGMTVTDALALAGYSSTLVTVFVDGLHVPQDEWPSQPLPDGAEVKAIHLHHGG